MTFIIENQQIGTGFKKMNTGCGKMNTGCLQIDIALQKIII